MFLCLCISSFAVPPSFSHCSYLSSLAKATGASAAEAIQKAAEAVSAAAAMGAAELHSDFSLSLVAKQSEGRWR